MRTTQTIVARVAAALLIAVTATAHAGKGFFMNDTIELPEMRTHCIGRYQIDLPEEFVMTKGSYMALYYGLDKNFQKVEIQNHRQRGDSPSLERLVGAEKSALVNDEHFRSPSKNMLAAVKEVNRDAYLVESYISARDVDSLKLHLFAQRGEAIARLQNKKYSDDIEPRPLSFFESQLTRIANNTRYVATPEQAGRSSCLGTLAIDDKQDGEVYSVYFISEKHPDVSIHIDMNSLTEKGDGGLLARVSGKAGLLRALDFSSKPLRKGKRQMAGRPGEELLDSGKQDGKVQRYFVAETLITEPSNLNRPVIAINMSVGGLQDKQTNAYLDPSLTEKESIAWWDAIVDSLRAR
ncbi:MAG TPA: T6SS immunity protein Tli4 family protein [Azonexus sp.]|nr:T6SS immunity protein Tli4 family protein [Azonexus sp.]